MPAKWSRHVFSFRFYEGKINCAPHLRAALRRADTQKLSQCGGTAQGRLSDLPNADPTGRVEEMEKRLDATLSAVKTMQPALARFYDSMRDEQKTRFNSLRSASRPTGCVDAPAAAEIQSSARHGPSAQAGSLIKPRIRCQQRC